MSHTFACLAAQALWDTVGHCGITVGPNQLQMFALQMKIKDLIVQIDPAMAEFNTICLVGLF
jgi:hypothetical protein